MKLSAIILVPHWYSRELGSDSRSASRATRGRRRTGRPSAAAGDGIARGARISGLSGDDPEHSTVTSPEDSQFEEAGT